MRPSYMNPKSFSEALVGFWPSWLGKSQLARLLCRCGLHTWWRSDPYMMVKCARCGTLRGW